MQLQIKAQGLDLSDATRAYTEEKVGRLERFLAENHKESAIADVHLIYAGSNTKATKDKCHITVSGVGKGLSFHGESEEPEMHVAIDAAVQTLEEQLRRHHDKLRDHQQREAVEAKQIPAEALMETEPVQPEISDEDDR